MKNLQYSIMIFFIALSMYGEAMVQPPVKIIISDNLFTKFVYKTNPKKENKDSIQLFLFKNNLAAKKSGIDLLGWEPKLKFRLSHNLNIIFSYN